MLLGYLAKNSQYPLKNVHNRKVENNVLLGALLRTSAQDTASRTTEGLF